jgi:hypothetical protein
MGIRDIVGVDIQAKIVILVSAATRRAPTRLALAGVAMVKSAPGSVSAVACATQELSPPLLSRLALVQAPVRPTATALLGVIN